MLSGLPPGTYEVIAELTDHEPAVERLTLKEGDPPLEGQLDAPAFQERDEHSGHPLASAGGDRGMDGARVGQTPLRGQSLRVGNRRIVLTTGGYQPYAVFLTVEEGKTARLDARLAAIDSAAGADTTPEAPTPAPVASATRVPPRWSPRPSRRRPLRPRCARRGERGARAAPQRRPRAQRRPRQDLQGERGRPPPKKLSGDSHQPSLRSGEELSVTLAWTVTRTARSTDLEIVQSGGKLTSPSARRCESGSTPRA